MISDMTLTGIPQSDANPLAAELNRPWQEAQAKHAESMKSWRNDAQSRLDSAIMDWDGFTQKNPIDLRFAPDPETAKQKVVISSYLALANDGQEIPGGDMGEKLMRDRLADERFGGKGIGDDAAFYGEIVRDANDRKVTTEFFNELSDEAVKAATVGAVGESATSFQAWREQAKTKPGYKPGNDADYLEAWQASQQEMKARMEPFKDELAQVWQAMKGGGAGTASEVLKSIGADLLLGGGADGEDTVDELSKKNAGAVAFDVYEKLDESNRADFMKGLDALVKSFPKEERPSVIANLSKSGGRMVDDLARGAASRFSVKSLEESLNREAAKTMGPFSLSESEKTQASANADKIQRDRLAQKNFADDIRKIERGEYDPIRYFSKESKDVFSMRTVESGLYGIPGVLASVGTVMLPGVGQSAMFLAMEDFAYSDLRDNAIRSGMSDADASLFADDYKTIAAVPQTGLEILQTYAPLGKLPTVNKVLMGMGDKIKNRLLRGAIKTGAISGAETVVEEAQNLTPYIVQDIASAFESDVTGAKWTGEGGAFDGFWTRQATTFLSMMPLAVGGAMGGLNAEARDAAFANATTTQLQAIGATDEAIAAVNAANGPASLREAVTNLWETSDPNSENAKVAAAQEEVRIAEEKAAAQAGQQSGVYPIFDRTAEGWSVKDGETREEIGTATTWQDALRIGTDHSSMIDEKNMDQVAYLATILQAGEITTHLDNENRQTGFSFNPGQKGKFFATSERVEADFELTPADEARILAQSKAKGGTFVGSILGQSVTKFKQNVRNTVNKIMGSGSVLTVFHEEGHGFFREALRTGRLTKPGTIETIRYFQQSFVGKKTKAGEDIQFLPAEGDVTDEQLDEAVSELLEVFVLKNRKKIGYPSKMVSDNLSAIAKRHAPTKAFTDFMSTLREFFGVVFSRAYEIRKAIKEGKVKESDIEAFTNKLFGLDAQDEFDTAAVAARDEILGGDPFSLGKDRSTMDADYTNSPGGANIGDRAQPGNSAVFETDSDAIEAGFSEGPYFHGTPEGGFSEFDETKTSRPQKLEKGAYFFTDSEDAAEQYSQDGTNPEILRVRLKIKKPLILGRDVLKALEDGDASKNFDTWEEQIAAMEKEGLAFRDGNELYISCNYNQELIDYANEHGFDSFRTIDDAVDSVGNRILSWAVLDPSQIAIIDPARFNQSTPADSGAYSLGPARMADALADEAVSRIKNPQARMVVMRALANKIATAKADLIAISEGRPPSYRERQTKESFDGAQHEQSMIALEDERQAAEDDFDQAVADLKAEEQGAIQDARADVLSKLGPNNGQNQAGKVAYNEAVRQAVAKVREAQKTKREKLRKEHTATVAKLDAKQKALAKRAAVSDTKAKGDRRRNAEVATVRQEMAFAKEQQRRDILTSLAMFDGILSVLPTHLRGKVGGYTTLASLTTDEARLKYLQTRVAKIDDVVQSFLKKEYSKMLDKLLERAKPVKGKPGEKPKGKAGADVHSLFAVLEEARGWSQDKVDQHVDGLLSVIAAGNLTPEQEAHNTLEASLVGLVGNWKEADAARRGAAIEAATKVFEAGYYKFKLASLIKAEDREVRRKSLVRDTGRTGEAGERDAKLLADNGLKGGWKDNFLSLISFEQLTEYIFGRDSAEARRIVDMEREASAMKEDSIQADMDGLDDLFTQLGGSQLDGEKLRWELSQKSIKIGTRQLSQMEMVDATLMWRQEDGRRHFLGHKDENGNYVGKWHYDQAFMDSIEAKLSDEAKAVRAYLSADMALEYPQINPTFIELNGINLPQNANYWMISVKPQQASAGQMVDPVTGSTMSGSSTTPGSLKTRGQAIAEPEFKDALQKYIAHKKQIRHWIAYAPFNAEVGTILRNRDLGNSIEAKGGDQALSVMRGWIDYFVTGGVRDAASHLALNQMMNRISGRAASSILIGRMGVVAIQTTQLGAALAEMPVGSFAVRFGKLFTGQLEWGAAFRSEYIQRRLAQMPASVQQAMEGLKASKPNRLKYNVQKLGRLISGVDALMTAGTFAMVHDYQLKQAKGMNLAGAEAEAYAMQAAERSVDRIAQPTRPGTRSLFENTASNPAMRVLWAFASESRQKLALSLWRLGAADRSMGEKARAVAVTWIVGGMIATLIRAAMRDIRSDDDEEVFDEKNWGLKRLTLSSLTGPFGGLPFFGDALEAGVYKMAGEYLPEGNLLSSVPNSFKAATRVSDWGDKKPDEIMRDVETILSGAAFFNDSLSASSSLSHLARDLFGIVDNFTD